MVFSISFPGSTVIISASSSVKPRDNDGLHGHFPFEVTLSKIITIALLNKMDYLSWSYFAQMLIGGKQKHDYIDVTAIKQSTSDTRYKG